MQIALDITINAPLSRTYQVFTDIENADTNIAGIEQIELIKTTSDFVGTRWKETRTEFGKQATVEMWVTDATENDYYIVESYDHGMHYLSTYRFEELDTNTTKVFFEFEGIAQSLGAKLMSPMMIFFAGATKKLFMKDMEDLKALVENKSASS